MTDDKEIDALVGSLKERAGREFWGPTQYYPLDLLLEAADMIERLRVSYRSACALNDEMWHERDALKATVEGLRKDAARYRWLALHVTNGSGEDGGVFAFDVSLPIYSPEWPDNAAVKRDFDAAIDAAMGSVKV